jgi:nucleotide-binding universal stress UspA family protein
MYSKILVPLDGSEFSECSLEHVKAIASGCHVPEVVLFRVTEPLSLTEEMINELGEDLIEKADTRYEKVARDYLKGIADKLASEDYLVGTVVEHGQPAQKILEYADKNRVDLIIMSTHGRSGVVRWALGSVADKVARHSKVPVLIIAPMSCRIT